MLFLGCLFDRALEKEYLSRSKRGLSNAANTFQWNLIEGIKENHQPLTIVNALPVGTFPKHYRQLVLPDREWEHNGEKNYELGCLNLPFIKQYQRFRRAKKIILASNDKEILLYSAYSPFLKAIYRLDPSRKVTLIVTDLPEYYDLGKTTALHRFFRRQNNKKIAKYLNRVDRFVLLTEAMKVPLQVGNRPYVVVEGVCGAKQDLPKIASEENERIILYTGTLFERFGIGTLLDAFSAIEDPNYRLWICGGGGIEERIKKASEEDSRIRFLGYVTKERVLELQAEATVLINPRPNGEEYTKYSFPSKTMEYMLSGKPVIAYKLDGIPAEYDDYIFYANGTSAEDLKEKIVEVCSMTESERKGIGRRASDFVKTQKSAKKQAEKILRLLEEKRI